MTSHGLLLLAAGIVLALVLGRALWLHRRPAALEVLAAALLAYPIARALVGAAWVVERLTRYTVLLPAPREAFELAIVRDLSLGFALPLAGALLLWRSRAGAGEARTLADVRDAAERALAPLAVRLAWPGRAAWLDALTILGAAMLLQGLALAAQGSFARVLVTGDESNYWINLTLPLLLGLSIAAGLSEEFVWRGALLRALLQRMGWLGAIALQAMAFGFIHAGYGNWAHVVGPALFGALMGLVALRVGLLATVVTHAGVNVMYLALVSPHLQPAAVVLLVALALACLTAAAITRGRAVRALFDPSAPGLARSRA